MSDTQPSAPRADEPIEPEAIPEALTRASFAYADGSTQVFGRDGHTTFTENGRPTRGEWGVNDDGRFWSFWPPSYRAGYDLFWITEGEMAVGVRFVDQGTGATSDGRYAP
jgi:hypothetical protein